VGSLSPIHWIIIFASVLPVIPIAKVLSRAGFSGWWALLYFVPVIGLVAFWVFAYAHWPKVNAQSQAGTLSWTSPSAGETE
jgi:uncharacterized membrane protein YhaH (DUF805 family)